jgi:hypothetical protein
LWVAQNLNKQDGIFFLGNGSHKGCRYIKRR